MAQIGVIPFSSRGADVTGARIAQGLALELTEWFGRSGAVPTLLTSAQTDDDGAWRRLVSFREELTSAQAAEVVEALAGEEGGPPEFAAVVSGMVDATPAETGGVAAILVAVTVTDAAGAFSRGRVEADISPVSLTQQAPRLFREVTELLGLASPGEYDPLTRHFQAWLNLLILRALKLAAELGALERDEDDVYEPAIAAARLDPGLTAARDRLGELAQVLVFERGFAPLDAASALETVVARVGPDWRSQEVRGRLLLVAEKPDQAAKAFCQVIKGKLEAPNEEERRHAALMAGRAFNLASRHVEAQRVLGLAMQDESLKLEAIIEAGDSSAALGEVQVAERLWQRAVEMDKSHVSARLRLARLSARRKEADQAVQHYTALLEVPDLRREVFSEVAEYFVIHQLHEQACRAAEKYAEAYPGDAIAHVLLASALNATSRHKRALKALEQAELCTGVGELQDLVLRQRRYAEHPDAEQRFRKLATEAFEADPASAERGLRELLAAYPDFWEAGYFLGISLRRAERWQDACNAFEKVRGHRSLQGVDKELTGIYSRLGNSAKSLECATRALESDPEDAELLCNMASALLENGKLDEAVKYAQRAHVADPQDMVARKTLDILRAKLEKRSLFANLKSVFREATGWLRPRKKPPKP